MTETGHPQLPDILGTNSDALNSAGQMPSSSLTLQPAIAEDRSLELDGMSLERVVLLASEYLGDFLKCLRDDTAASYLPAVVGSLSEPIPECGQQADQVLGKLFKEVLRPGVETAGPRYFGYIPGGGLPESAIADLISGVVNRYVGVSNTAPGCAELEKTVIRWLCDIVGLGKNAGGFLTSGGSLANWTAVVTALHRRCETEFDKGMIYASDQTHHSIKKAAQLAGIPASNVRIIGTDADFKIRPRELKQRIAHDRRDGLRPFMLIGNAGTTSTGAVDVLESLADIAVEERLWFHIDAAYGGFFALTEAGRRVLIGLERGDSITLDPHKGLFLPYGTGSLLVKDVEDLRSVHQVPAAYIRHASLSHNCPEEIDLADISPELTRSFRALRLWLPLKIHGIRPFRINLDEKMHLAQWLSSELKRIPNVQVITEPQLSTVTFCIRPKGCDGASLARINEKALNFINERKRVFLTSTVLRDQVVIRVCVLSFRTHREHVTTCLEEIRTAAMHFSG